MKKKLFNGRWVILLTCLFVIGGCDSHLYTQFFRNPYTVDIASLKTLQADKWYEFDVSANAYNRTQKIRIKFKGSEPDKLDTFIRGGDENYQGGERVFYSSSFPDKEINFEVLAFDENDVEYVFKASGLSSGIVFYNEGEPLIGKVIKKIKVKANLTLTNAQITWISYTGK